MNSLTPFLLLASGFFQHPFEQEIQAFEVADAKTPPPKHAVLFIGSSSVVRWTTLAADFPGIPTLNRGFGGSAISDSVDFASRIVFPYQPKVIVLYAGTNDIAAGKSPETVFQDYCRFVSLVQDKLPKTKVVFISMSPAPSRFQHAGDMRLANVLIRQYTQTHPGLYFANTFPFMISKEGGPRPELFVADQLHLNAEGYRLVSSTLRPVLERAVKDADADSVRD